MWLGSTGFDWFWIGFYRVLPGFTGFYRVLPGFTGLVLCGHERCRGRRRGPSLIYGAVTNDWPSADWDTATNRHNTDATTSLFLPSFVALSSGGWGLFRRLSDWPSLATRTNPKKKKKMKMKMKRKKVAKSTTTQPKQTHQATPLRGVGPIT